jgi:hypothetical protein
METSRLKTVYCYADCAYKDADAETCRKSDVVVGASGHCLALIKPDGFKTSQRSALFDAKQERARQNEKVADVALAFIECLERNKEAWFGGNGAGDDLREEGLRR